MRDRLVSAVLAGEKVATSSLLAQYEAEGEALPRAGELRAVVDSSGRRVAMVEVMEVLVIRLGDADERLARDEGEGFRSVAEWREAHEDFWRREVLPELRRPHELDDDAQVVVERFRVVDELEAEARRITGRLTAWAKRCHDIRALAIVGSRARGTPRPDSDLDLLILTDGPERFTDSDEWLEVLEHPPIIRRGRFGVITERRIQLPCGLEVEFGIGTTAWASTDPVDAGTARVVREGLRVLHDPDGLLAKLQATF